MKLFIPVDEIEKKKCPWTLFPGKPGSLEYAKACFDWFQTNFPDGDWVLDQCEGWYWVHQSEKIGNEYVAGHVPALRT